MVDRLIRPFPPLANEWIHGVATTGAAAPEVVDAMAAAVAAGEVLDEHLGPLASAVAAVNSTYFRFELAGLVDHDDVRFRQVDCPSVADKFPGREVGSGKQQTAAAVRDHALDVRRKRIECELGLIVGR